MVVPVGGGAGHVAIHLAEEAAKAGHGVEILTMHYGDLPREEERGAIRIHRVPCGRKNQDSSYLLEMARFVAAARPLLDRVVAERTPDIIHAHAIIPDGWMGTRPARCRGVPLVITAHGSDVPGYNPDKFGLAHRLMRPVWRRTLNRAAAVVTPSEHLASMIRRAYGRGSGSNEVTAETFLRVIPNGIRTDLFGEAPKDDSFLIVSRLVRRKNYHIFLEALRGIEVPQTVHVVGDGPMLDELKRIASGLPRHRVVFHGWLANGSVEWRELYERCRYFVFPSESENFPVNLLEAQLAGLIVLAGDVPGSREVLGEEAIYFPSLDGDSMTRTVRAILNDEIPGVAALGARGSARVRAKFSWTQVANRCLNLYRGIAEGRA